MSCQFVISGRVAVKILFGFTSGSLREESEVIMGGGEMRQIGINHIETDIILTRIRFRGGDEEMLQLLDGSSRKTTVSVLDSYRFGLYVICRFGECHRSPDCHVFGRETG